MGKNTVFQIREIGENVKRLAGKDVMKKVMEGSEQIAASSKPEKVVKWVKGAIEALDTLVDEETRNQVMTNCGYNCALVNCTPIEKARARREKFKTEDEFLKAEQKNPPLEPG